MTNHAEEKREKAKYDAEVSVTNMNDYPIQIIHECSPNLVPDRLFVPMLDKVTVEYIRMDEHEHLIREMKTAAEFALMTFEHAQALGYLGEGSTMGMANDAIAKLYKALGREPESK